MKFIDYVDRILCINLDIATERWSRSQVDIDKMGWSSKLERLSAIEFNPGCIAIVASMYKAFKVCQERNYRNILLLEDDAKWVGGPEIMDKACEQIPEDFDLVYLCGRCPGHRAILPLVTPNLVFLKKVSFYLGTAILFSRRCVNKLVTIMESFGSEPLTIAQGFYKQYGTTDVFLAHHVMGRCKTYGVYPLMTIQYNGYSYICQNNRPTLDHPNSDLYFYRWSTLVPTTHEQVNQIIASDPWYK